MLNMRKFVLVCLLAVSFVVVSQEKKTYEIGILLDTTLPQLDPLLDELKNEVSNVVGEDAIIHFSNENILSNELNLERAEANYLKFLNSEVDIILAFGLFNNVLLFGRENYPIPVILFGAVNNDFININEDSPSSGIDNFTYLIASRSYKEDLKTLHELSGFKRVGIVIQKPFMELFPYNDYFNEILKPLDAEFKIIPYMTYEDITLNLDDIDALYIAEGFYLNPDEIEALAKECIQLKIPSFTSNNIDEVRRGILATNQAEDNLNQFFRRIALNVEAYIIGEALASLPVYLSLDSKLTLNYNTAEQIGLPMKYSLIAMTDFIGDFDKKLSDKKYNLLDMITEILTDNLALQTSLKDVDLSEKDVQSAWTNYIPSVTAGTSATYTDPNLAERAQGLSPEFSTDGNIALSQTIFSPGANVAINSQKDFLQAQKERYNSEQLDAIFEASNAYFNALILKANLQILVTNLDLTKKNLEIARQNYDAGLAGKSDVLRFRSEVAQDMQFMIEAANDVEQAFFEINRLLNNPIDYSIDVDEVELEKGLYQDYSYMQLRNLLDDPRLRKPFVKFLIEEAKLNAPELKSLDYDISAIGRTVKLNSGGRFIPTLALQGQYNYNFNQSGVGVNPDRISDYYNVGLNLAIPIIDQNKQNINRQIALIQKDQLNLNKSNINLSIEANVNNAVLNLINQVSNIELSGISEIAARESLDLTQTSYSNGAVTIVQLIDAQNNYLSSSLAKANAVYNYLLASLRLERFLGYYFLLHTKAENDNFIAKFQIYMEQNNDKN